jgi:lysophospholipase L1-like esterase
MGDSFAAGKNGSAQFPRSMMEPLWDATANEGVGAFEVANWETVVNWDRCILGYAEDIDSTIFDYMNCAIGSTTAANWATTGDDYITTYVLPYYPKYAVVSLGYNDSTDWDGVSANIDNVADTLKANSIIPVFITVLPARSSDTAERKAQITSINTGLKAYCLANNIACIDAYERLEDDDTPLQRDAAFGSTIVVHPNSQCYRCIADMLYSATIFDSGANGWLRR